MTPAKQPNVRLQWAEQRDVRQIEIQGERMKGVWSFWERERNASQWNAMPATDALVDAAMAVLNRR
jgi:hypothetical protein